MTLEEDPAVVVRLDDGRPTEVLLSIRMEPRTAAELAQLCDRLAASKGERHVRQDPRDFRIRTVKISSLPAADAACWTEHIGKRESWVVCHPIDDPTGNFADPHTVGSILVGWEGLEIVIEDPAGKLMGIGSVRPVHLAALAVLGSGETDEFVDNLLALDQRDPGFASGCLGASHEAIIGHPEVGKDLPPSALVRVLEKGSRAVRLSMSTNLRAHRGSDT